MSNYDDIKAVMDHKTTPSSPTSKAIEAKYPGPHPTTVRKFLPYLLGYSPGPGGTDVPVVLCYQYVGPPPIEAPPSIKNWRCFKVDALTAVAITEFQPDPTFTPPAPLKFGKVKKQNGIDDVQEWRRKNYIPKPPSP
jgi:hypothetical protein